MFLIVPVCTHCMRTTKCIALPRGTQLPFAELEGAPQGFSDFNEIGGWRKLCRVPRPGVTNDHYHRTILTILTTDHLQMVR